MLNFTSIFWGGLALMKSLWHTPYLLYVCMTLGHHPFHDTTVGIVTVVQREESNNYIITHYIITYEITLLLKAFTLFTMALLHNCVSLENSTTTPEAIGEEAWLSSMQLLATPTNHQHMPGTPDSSAISDHRCCLLPDWKLLCEPAEDDSIWLAGSYVDDLSTTTRSKSEQSELILVV